MPGSTEAAEEVRRLAERAEQAEKDQAGGLEYSISAWGTRVMPVEDKIAAVLGGTRMVKINAAVGVRWDRKTGEFRVAFSICNEKDRFVKKVAYSIVRGRLDGWSPLTSGVATFGCYHGSKPVQDLFIPITKFFRSIFVRHQGYRGSLENTIRARLSDLLLVADLRSNGVSSGHSAFADSVTRRYTFNHSCDGRMRTGGPEVNNGKT